MQTSDNSLDMINTAGHNLAAIERGILSALLRDKTTGKNVLWATGDYISGGNAYHPNREITLELITGSNVELLRPRVFKSQAERMRRTCDKAEVFTPSWVCNAQNNLVDDAWFGYSGVFNRPDGQTWAVNTAAVVFPVGKTWRDYVDACRLEISCGEAPYLVSRYDTVTGEFIPIMNRIGLLDRKLRVVGENTENEADWLKWCIRAFQSIYGYEYQGDSLLLARVNLFFTFVEYYQERFQRRPESAEIKPIVNIIAWNLWQMDGLTLTAPYSEAPCPRQQFLLDFDDDAFETVGMPCQIYDWRAKKALEFKSLLRGGAICGG